MEWQRAPVIECLHCGKKFQLEEYYEYEIDDEILCPNCDGKMVVKDRDNVVEFALSRVTMGHE